MKAILIAAIIATLYWSPWQFSGTKRDPFSPTVHYPIWEPPPSARLRVEILAAEWIAIGGIWAIMAWGRKSKKETQPSSEVDPAG